MVLNIAICDDESNQSEWLEGRVNSWADSRGRNVKISRFTSAEAFLFEFQENKSFDILLLDVEMKAMNGIELARNIRAEDRDVKIIFVTGYADYMAEGFDVSALHYLLKPIDTEKLFSVLDRAVNDSTPERRRLMLSVGRETVFVYADEVIYAESQSHYIVFNTSAASYRVRMTMPEASQLLGGDFCRCGRSFVVGLSHVKRITKTSVLLNNGLELPLGKGMHDVLNKSLIAYLKEH